LNSALEKNTKISYHNLKTEELKGLKESIIMDKIGCKEFIKAEICNGKPFNIFLIMGKLFHSIPSRFIFLLRFGFILKNKNIKFAPGIIIRHLALKYGCYINLNSKIGIGIRFPHPNGIVIGEGVVIGKNCTIYQQVTLGGKIIGDSKNGNYPQVSDNVVIFAGAKLIGNITIGEHSIIGANSVVTKDVPHNVVVAGIPANFIKYNY
jgi:serine O-acetyltransferase